MSLTRNQLKLIKDLRIKKHRKTHQLFVAEGLKVVNEFVNAAYEIVYVFYTKDADFSSIKNSVLVSDTELQKLSNLKSPNKVVAVFKIPEQKAISKKGLIVALDALNDPGNLGTIIRLCDWFGVQELVCSKDTVDCYNSKVIQAAMGSLARVAIRYIDLISYLQQTELPVFSTLMNGENVYQQNLPQEAVLIMGNEANGISEDIQSLASSSLSIPRFGSLQQTESLNVATATAILLSEFKR